MYTLYEYMYEYKNILVLHIVLQFSLAPQIKEASNPALKSLVHILLSYLVCKLLRSTYELKKPE